MPIPTLGILDIKIAINFYHKILINAKGQILGLYTVSAKANKSEVGTRVRLPTLRHSTRICYCYPKSWWSFELRFDSKISINSP